MKKKHNIIKVSILFLVTCVYLIPIIMMVLGSLKPKAEAIRFDLSLPSVIEWSNYTYVLEKGHVLTGYFNSFIMTAAATVLVLLFGALAGIYVGRNGAGRPPQLIITLYWGSRFLSRLLPHLHC